MKDIRKIDLKMIAWELTRSCNLSCVHCRASSKIGPYPGELSTKECFEVIDNIASFACPVGDRRSSIGVKPIIILTGGEPLLREDIFEIIKYGKSKGLPIVMAPNGTLLTKENVEKILEVGIKRISVSLDGPDAKSHDEFRKVPGAFDAAINGIKEAKKQGLEVQINSTITRRNIKLIPLIMKLAQELNTEAYHLFLLVPTGRAKEMEGDELSPQEYEETLKFLNQCRKKFPLEPVRNKTPKVSALPTAKISNGLEIKTTCAPHFNRILLQDNPKLAGNLMGRGCMGGVSFCFISHIGQLQPCGYLELNCGNVRNPGGFKKAWQESEIFNNIRDFSKYVGKCGVCEFRYVCAGCRARAFAKYGDYLREEPYCVHLPKMQKNKCVSV